MFRRLVASENANTAMTFGVMALPIFMAVGLAVDYSDLARTKAEAQSIADAAAIAAAVKQDKTSKEMFAIAKDYVHQAAKLKGNLKILSVTAAVPGEARLKVTVSARADTHLLRFIGETGMDFTVTSEAFRGFSNDMEVVFALDNTGSMGGTKLATLKKASKSLVDLLASPADNRVKFGLVPFSSYVNVGTANRNASWISVPADYKKTWCSKDVIEKKGCSMVPTEKDVCNDGYCEKKIENKEVCTEIIYSAACTTKSADVKWSGCVGSRPFPLNLGTSQPEVTYPGIMESGCASSYLSLTDNIKSVHAKIDAMKATGETYIPGGLLWGLNMLTPGAPGSTAKPFDPNGENRNPRKSLLLMTDGNNTKSPVWTGATPGAHSGGDTSLANQYTAMLCTNAKNLNIEVFTIAFQVTDPVTKDMLKKCASDEAHFFDADDNVELMFAFTDIAGTLRKVRLSQ